MYGMCALLSTTITPTQVSVSSLAETSSIINKNGSSARVEKPKVRYNRSTSSAPGLYSYMSSPKEVIQKYIFGYHSKTKRTLAEEAECGDEISVNSWIRDGYDPDELDAYGYTPLLNASALGRLNAVVELIKNGANVNKKGPFGFAPLHAAAQNGHREVVAELLKHGAEINLQNEDDDTAIHLALRSLHIEIVYMLLRMGANPKIHGFNNKNSVQVAREYGLLDLAKSLNNYNHSTFGHFTNSAPQILRKNLVR